MINYYMRYGNQLNGFDGYYEISNLGNIKNTKTWTGNMYIEKERKLKPTIYKNGYKNIVLKGKHFSIHRLVAKTFIPNPNNYPVVNHIDGNKLNNNVDNLEWCTYSHNEIEAYRIGIKNPKPTKSIVQYDLNGNFVKEWKNLSEIKRELGYSTGTLHEACSGKRKTAYKSIWNFKEEL